MAGALCAPEAMVREKFLPVQKNAGMVLSPFNAWVVLKGLETLSMRLNAQSAATLALAQWLEAAPGSVARVLPRPVQPPAACAGHAPDVGRGRRGAVV
jgi:O-succinylhomoserine sulfhydrylase